MTERTQPSLLELLTPVNGVASSEVLGRAPYHSRGGSGPLHPSGIQALQPTTAAAAALSSAKAFVAATVAASSATESTHGFLSSTATTALGSELTDGIEERAGATNATLTGSWTDDEGFNLESLQHHEGLHRITEQTVSAKTAFSLPHNNNANGSATPSPDVSLCLATVMQLIGATHTRADSPLPPSERQVTRCPSMAEGSTTSTGTAIPGQLPRGPSHAHPGRAPRQRAVTLVGEQRLSLDTVSRHRNSLAEGAPLYPSAIPGDEEEGLHLSISFDSGLYADEGPLLTQQQQQQRDEELETMAAFSFTTSTIVGMRRRTSTQVPSTSNTSPVTVLSEAPAAATEATTSFLQTTSFVMLEEEVSLAALPPSIFPKGDEAHVKAEDSDFSGEPAETQAATLSATEQVIAISVVAFPSRSNDEVMSRPSVRTFSRRVEEEIEVEEEGARHSSTHTPKGEEVSTVRELTSLELRRISSDPQPTRGGKSEDSDAPLDACTSTQLHDASAMMQHEVNDEVEKKKVCTPLELRDVTAHDAGNTVHGKHAAEPMVVSATFTAPPTPSGGQREAKSMMPPPAAEANKEEDDDDDDADSFWVPPTAAQVKAFAFRGRMTATEQKLPLPRKDSATPAAHHLNDVPHPTSAFFHRARQWFAQTLAPAKAKAAALQWTGRRSPSVAATEREEGKKKRSAMGSPPSVNPPMSVWQQVSNGATFSGVHSTGGDRSFLSSSRPWRVGEPAAGSVRHGDGGLLAMCNAGSCMPFDTFHLSFPFSQSVSQGSSEAKTAAAFASGLFGTAAVPHTALQRSGRLLRMPPVDTGAEKSLTPSQPSSVGQRWGEEFLAASLRSRSQASPPMSFAGSFAAQHEAASPLAPLPRGEHAEMREGVQQRGVPPPPAVKPTTSTAPLPVHWEPSLTHGFSTPAARQDDHYRDQLYRLFRRPPSCSIGDVWPCFETYKTMVAGSSGARHILHWRELSQLLLPRDYIDYSELFPSTHFVTFPDFVEFVEVLSVRHRR